MHLLPRPKQWYPQPGSLALAGLPARLGELHGSAEAVRQGLRMLKLSPRRDRTLPPHVLQLGEAPLPAPPVVPEGYALTVTPAGLALAGTDAAGFFWGLVTLQQLAAGTGRLPCGTLTDFPAFPFRLHHDDISRGQISTLADFRRIIRRLSQYKIRYYALYMEDVLFLPSHPEIGKTRGRLTRAEVLALRAEARRHNVTLIPVVSLMGHQENLFRLHPQYRKLAWEVFQEPSSFDPRKPATRRFLRAVIRDVCTLFPEAPYFHAGFDEAIGPGPEELIAHANWCAAEIAARGKEMLMWVDMFKNHFGLEQLHRLHPAIVPVEWNYDDPAAVADAYAAAKITPLGLAGYNNWTHFLPDFSKAKRNLDAWAGAMRQWGGAGYGASQWGDEGYENSRELCWNLFAYNAESAWTGEPGTADFEPRFQRGFYGRALPALERVIRDVPAQRRISPRRAWTLFRYTLPALIRVVQQQPALADDARADDRLFTRALAAQAQGLQSLGLPSKGLTAAEHAGAEHLEHFALALERERLVDQRLLLAHAIATGLSGAKLRTALTQHARHTRAIKKRYAHAWLRHNKPAGLAASLAVYDRVLESLREPLRPPVRSAASFTWAEVPYAAAMADVAGLPLQPAAIHGIPFRFAAPPHTHLELGETPLRVALPARPLKDLHFIYGAQTIHRDAQDQHPAVEVTLLQGGVVVFREELRTLVHLCDWWAPRGEHIWAGGGLKYADPRRVRWAFSPGPHFGLLHLSGFALPRGVVADTLELRRLAPEGFYLFALTAEHAGR